MGLPTHKSCTTGCCKPSALSTVPCSGPTLPLPGPLPWFPRLPRRVTQVRECEPVSRFPRAVDPGHSVIPLPLTVARGIGHMVLTWPLACQILCRRTEGRSEAHRPVAGDGACRVDIRVCRSARVSRYSGSGLPSMYAPHRPPLPLPGTGRGFLCFAEIRQCLIGSTTLAWLGSRSPESPVRPPGLAWVLRLGVDHRWTTEGPSGILSVWSAGSFRGPSVTAGILIGSPPTPLRSR